MAYIVIGGHPFAEPILQGVLIDPWINLIELYIGEAAPPHSWENPEHHRITYSDVVEIRCFSQSATPGRLDYWRSNESYQDEGIDDAGEVDASEEVEWTGETMKRLRSVAFRRPDSELGRRWSLLMPGSPRVVWIGAWRCYLEFLYAGHVTHTVLSRDEIAEEWRLQFQRFYRHRGT